MFKQGYIYVIAFDSGTLKVGRAADGASRLATHRREAGRHGVGVVAAWCSPPCGGRAAAFYERKLIEFCESRGVLRAGNEYFGGLDFSEVRKLAEELVGVVDPRAPRSKDTAARLPTPDRQGFPAAGASLRTPSLPGQLLPLGASHRVGHMTVRTSPGIEQDQAREELRARMPTPEETLLLDLPSGEPVMEVLRTVRAPDGRVIEYAKGVHPASRFVWSYTFKIPD